MSLSGNHKIPAHLVLLLRVTLSTVSCGCGDKHLPSSNPLEYDPTKLYTSPNAPATSVAKPAGQTFPPIQLPPLEPGPNEKGAWRKVPVDPESLKLFKDKNPREALSRIVQGLGSAQLLAVANGHAFKKLLGTQAESIAVWD